MSADSKALAVAGVLFSAAVVSRISVLGAVLMIVLLLAVIYAVARSSD